MHLFVVPGLQEEVGGRLCNRMRGKREPESNMAAERDCTYAFGSRRAPNSTLLAILSEATGTTFAVLHQHQLPSALRLLAPVVHVDIYSLKQISQPEYTQGNIDAYNAAVGNSSLTGKQMRNTQICAF